MPRPAPFLFAALAAALCSPASAAPEPSAYAALAALEARVAAIGFRLTTANARWCPRHVPQLGWLLGDRRLYDADQWPQARLAYGAGEIDAPFIAAIAPGAPAANAGLAVGDAVTGLDWQTPAPPRGGDENVATPGGDDTPFVRLARYALTIAALPPGAALLVTTGDGAVHRPVAVPGCASDFRVEARDRPAGGADGRLVRISAGLAEFAADDAELAAAMAHELAHNILRHPARLEAAGVKRGLFGQFGRSARRVRQTEVEADRLSVWLLYGAGYDPGAAVRFWQRFGKRGGPVLFQPATHPRWQARVKLLEREIAVLRAARSTGAPLVPPLIAAPPPLE